MRAAMQTLTRDEINEHRIANGHKPFSVRAELENVALLEIETLRIERCAPFGNDPWGSRPQALRDRLVDFWDDSVGRFVEAVVVDVNGRGDLCLHVEAACRWAPFDRVVAR